MDGLKLARAIRDCWPLIELILTSGHFDVPEGDIPERGLFFSKPYRDEKIVSALRDLSAAHWLATNPAKPVGGVRLGRNPPNLSPSAIFSIIGWKRTVV
jgi:hypothetical protein